MEDALGGFYGQYQTTLDEKGRFALPAKLRSVTDGSGKPQLEGELILTKGLEGCLALYPQSEWEEIQKRLSSLNFTKKDFRFFSRRFYSAATIVTPDKNGRILIPSHLVGEAKLKKELLVLGIDRSVEIWNPDRYEFYQDQFPGSYEEVAERLFMTGDGHEDE